MRERVLSLTFLSAFVLALAGNALGWIVVFGMGGWVGVRITKVLISDYKKDHPDQRWFL